MTAPNPLALADELEKLAKALRTPNLLHRAEVLAARGWPSHGSGQRGVTEPCDHTDESKCGCGVTLTSVEQAATTRGPYAGIDDTLGTNLRAVYLAVGNATYTVATITAHADPESTDRANTHAGSGSCICCGDYCSGANNDRLKAGLDAKCYRAWEREGRPDRSPWIIRRRRFLAEKDTPTHVDPTDLVGTAGTARHAGDA